MSSGSARGSFDFLVGRAWPLALAIGVAANLTAFCVTLVEPDSALYAAIARRMAESGDFANLFARGSDWLDKPHLPFWLTAASFRLLGVNDVAYRLPAFLFWGLGLLYTGLLAARFYGRDVARLSVLILLTAYHLVLSNADTRAEPYLLGLVTGSVYHLVRAQRGRSCGHLLAGAALLAGAVMTKGPFLVLPAAGALGLHWVLKRDVESALQWRWPAVLLLVGVLITPELYCLWTQFDLHPEKVVFGRTGVSGVRFFFIDSQFGRFLNDGPIRGNGSLPFYLHTLLWAFLPWSAALYACFGAAALGRARALRKPFAAAEYHTWGAALPTLALFSASGFQLPHYTNILFPFFAILVADWLLRLEGPARARMARVQSAAGAVFMSLLGFLLVVFDPPGAVVPALLLAGGALACLLVLRRPDLGASVKRSWIGAVLVGLAMNLCWSPALLRYQAGSEAAQGLRALPDRPVGVVGTTSYAFEFYAPRPVETWDIARLAAAATSGPVYAYLPEEQLAAVEAAGLRTRVVGSFDSFHVTRLRWSFLSSSTRSRTLSRHLLVEAQRQP